MLESYDRQPEFRYFKLPGTDYADVMIFRNEKEVTDGNGKVLFYKYDCNQFRTTLDRETIEKNLDFYFTYVPPAETGIDYPKKIADLEQQLIETQMALCDIYEAMEAMNG